MGSVLSGFAIIASTVTTPDVSYTPNLVLVPVGPVAFGDLPFPLIAFSDSPGGISYGIASGPAVIHNGLVTVTGLGLVTIVVNQLSATNFSAANVISSFTVVGMKPGLKLAPIHYVALGMNPITVHATSDSPGIITFSIVSGPATLSGSTLTFTGAGDVVLRASQASFGNYAQQIVTMKFAVKQGDPNISLPQFPVQAQGNQFSVTATSSSIGAITYSILSGPATIAGNEVTITGNSGIVVILATQAASTDYKAAVTTVAISVN